MSWWKKANDGQDLEARVKHKIRSSPFFARLFQMFHIPMSALDGLAIKVQRLQGNFCEAGEDEILVDDRLASDPELFNGDFHFMAHEILHWLHRQREKNNYFADPEEVQGFNTGIAYMMSIGRQDKDIASIFLPLIQINIKDDNKAMEFLQQRLNDARKLLSDMGL